MLNPERKIIFDGHCHTNASFDSSAVPERQVDAAVKNGIDVLALTDHLFSHSLTEDTFTKIRTTYHRAQEYIDKNNLPTILIPGIEITAVTNHLVLLGVNYAKLETYMRKHKPFEIGPLLAWTNDNNVLAFAAHPAPYVVGLGDKTMEKAVSDKLLFGAETVNDDFRWKLDSLPMAYEVWKILAKRRTSELGLRALAHSDAHKPERLGSVANQLIYQGEPITDVMSAFAVITDKNTRWSPIVK